MDTFGCTPKFLAENPKAAQALVNSYFEALEMIEKDPKKSYEIMGADVKQTGEQFEASADVPALAGQGGEPEVLRRRACRQFSKEAADLLLEIGIIKAMPDLSTRSSTRASSSRPARAGGDAARGARLARASRVGATPPRGSPMKPLVPSPGAPDRARHRLLRAVRRRVERRDLRRLRLEDLPRRSADDAARRLGAVREHGFAKDVGITVWRVLGGFVLAARPRACRWASRWARTSRSRRSSSRSCRSRATCRPRRSSRC